MKAFAISACFNLVWFSAVIAMPACNKKSYSTPMSNITSGQHPVATDTVHRRYLALGDSYTIGQSVQQDERFPYFIVSYLHRQNITITDPEYIATTGWTTYNLQMAIAAKEPLGTYDVVTLLIGVNDQYQGRDTADYRNRFTQLLHKSVALAGNRPERVVVISIPDYSATPFVGATDKAQVSKEIDAFNVINKQVTLQNNCAYVDITPLTREVTFDPSLLASDGLHYSAKEHTLWAGKIAPVIQKILQ